MIHRDSQIPEKVEELAWFGRLHGDARDQFLFRARAMPETIREILDDRLQHLLPVILIEGDSIPALRRRIGRANWRKIHHASEHTNFLRSLIRLRFGCQAKWADIVALPEHHLRSCRNAVDWPTAQFAGRLAQPGQFLQTAMLYRDVVKMGGRPDQNWSYTRLKRAHGKLSVTAAIAAADPAIWCDPFTFDADGYSFVQLVSDRDFVTEGKSLRHCVATYRAQARDGSCVVMRCTGEERATLRFDRTGDLEVSGPANSTVSSRCKAASEKARASYFQHVKG